MNNKDNPLPEDFRVHIRGYVVEYILDAYPLGDLSHLPCGADDAASDAYFWEVEAVADTIVQSWRTYEAFLSARKEVIDLLWNAPRYVAAFIKWNGE